MNRKNHLKLLFAGFICCLATGSLCYGQSVSQAINSSGGTAVIGSTLHEWSIAEMTLITTQTSPVIILTQGLLQPVQTTLSINDQPPLRPELVVYPNPAEETLNFSITNIGGGIVNYRLVSIAGQTILGGNNSWQSDTINESIDVSRLSSGTYLLTFFFTQGTQHHTQTVKVIKK
jgi:hypothetical protein